MLAVLFSFFMLLPSLTSYAQTGSITLDLHNVRMQQVMDEIENQTRYLFGRGEDVNVNQTVSVKVANASVKEALDQMVKGTGIGYEIDGTSIILFKSEQSGPITVTGKVCDASGLPVPGAAVMEQGTGNGTMTDIDGKFSLNVTGGAASWR